MVDHRANPILTPTRAFVAERNYLNRHFAWHSRTWPITWSQNHAFGFYMSPRVKNSPDPDIIKGLNLAVPLRKLTAYIDHLEALTDFKAVLRNLAKITFRVASTVIAIGRKILFVALEIVTTLPRTLFGVFVASIVTFIVGTIPLIRPLLAAFVGPILLGEGKMRALFDFSSTVRSTKVITLQKQHATVRA